MVWPALAVAAAFNLSCTLHLKYQNMGYQNKASYEHDEAALFVVDLEKKRWCEDDCAETMPVTSSDEFGIVLYLNSSDGDFRSILISRESGSYEELRISGDSMWKRKGTCKVQPYTGLPQARF